MVSSSPSTCVVADSSRDGRSPSGAGKRSTVNRMSTGLTTCPPETVTGHSEGAYSV